MDRRTILAIGLMLIVALLPSIFLAPERAARRATPGSADTAATADSTGVAEDVVAPPPQIDTATVEAPPPDTSQAGTVVTVESPIYRFEFSNRGARITAATLFEYETFAPGDSGPAQLLPPESRFLDYRLVFGNDTLPLRDWTFVPSVERLDVRDGAETLEWTARRGGAEIRLRYTFRPDQYLFDVAGEFRGIAPRGLVLIGLGPRLAFIEADSTEDFREYGVVTKTSKTESLAFRSLDPGERRELAGPFEWVAVKSKYFVQAVMILEDGAPRLGGAVAVGGARVWKDGISADIVASLPAPGGAFGHAVYLGPQEYRRLAQIGHDFEDVKPYGWILRPVIRPFANLIVQVLLWMHETLSLEYGWVLILFGIAVRIVLWPLNQKAMRSSVAMQAVQPEIKAIQERYKNDPPKLQQEMMKLYKEHGVNPLGGCLPLLIPMPVLFALFFVFRETIEFRGVPFLWLPDLSRPDPYYIIPILMGLSMFAVSKIGQMGVPPNPQMKMMLYFMPGFLTLLFLRFSSGLNLYYAVSNIASIPQQWLVARERLKRLGKTG
jgi:YidC/Oxa1 family membrane protein insertase